MQTLKYNTRVQANEHHRRASSRVRSLATDWPSRLILEIDIGELLSGAVLHDEGGADIFATVQGGGKRLSLSHSMK